MKEFKVGDKCVVEYTVTEMTEGDYPIKCKTKNEIDESFTNDGRYYIGDVMPALKHIEDIIPKPEFPKWMMVADSPFNDTKIGNRRFVISKVGGQYVSLINALSNKDYEYNKYINNPDEYMGLMFWKYAKEIEPENNKLQELEEKYKELGQEIEKLKNK